MQPLSLPDLNHITMENIESLIKTITQTTNNWLQSKVNNWSRLGLLRCNLNRAHISVHQRMEVFLDQQIEYNVGNLLRGYIDDGSNIHCSGSKKSAEGMILMDELILQPSSSSCQSLLQKQSLTTHQVNVKRYHVNYVTDNY